MGGAKGGTKLNGHVTRCRQLSAYMEYVLPCMLDVWSTKVCNVTVSTDVICANLYKALLDVLVEIIGL